jgi:hypothetical protein
MTQPDKQPSTTQKWTDRPWFAAISAISLCVGIGLSSLNILAWSSAHREQQMNVQKELPRLRHFYLEIADTAFEEEIARNTPLTECPWIDTGVAPEGTRPIWIIDGAETKPQGEESAKGTDKSEGTNPSYQRPSLNCLRIENNGGTAALNCIVEADVYNLDETSVAAIGPNFERTSPAAVGPITLQGIKDHKQYKSERVTFSIGDLEPTKAILLPMFVGATESGLIASPLLSFGRVVLPKFITYTDILGNKLRLEVRQKFYTPIRIDAYISDKG